MKRDIVILAAALLLFAILVSVFRGYTVDDAYISFRYAENLARGNGLVFNEGERVEGYSNLAWTLLLAGAALLGVDVPSFARWAGILSGVAVLILVWFCSKSEERRAKSEKYSYAPLLLAAMVPFSAWAGAGLETVFHAALITAGMACLAPGGRGRALWIAAFLFGVAAISRPEGILFALAAAGALAITGGKRDWRRAVSWMAIPLAFLAAQVAFRLFYYGDWVPNTFHAKVGTSVSQFLDGLEYVGGFVYGFGWIPVNPPPLGEAMTFVARGFCALPLILLLVSLPGLFSGRDSRDRKDTERLIGWFSLLAIGLNVLFMIAVGGDWMRPYRFFAPILPAIALLLDRALADTARRFPGEIRRQAHGVLIALTLIAALLPAIPARVYADLYSRGIRMTSIRFGRELATRSQPGDTIAMGDCGALPYYSGLRVIDLYGLMNRRIAGWEGKATKAEPQPQDLDWIFDAEPRYISLEVSARSNAPLGLKGMDRAILAHPRFRAEYGPAPILTGQFSAAERTLIFERR